MQRNCIIKENLRHPFRGRFQYVIMVAHKLLLTQMIFIKLNHGKAGLFQQVNSFPRKFGNAALNGRSPITKRYLILGFIRQNHQNNEILS